ncbi:nucleotidyltransferase domain-containing protein [Thiomicrorhabdus sp. 6S2-11]|uniref:Nucleotidyltransferase domain-containing protein n=1 Tax=Thiomicrorhabdus marina TaxID=2818442 RepID=A0ABS3Q1Y6_9GAMM|nr:nucleotidyltransferase domain-containing protein [Thiomicrorhabdus marina]MBO1926329.1 nucleotidyltransferase domain-containing protein [Thiomicrorhabdus marina]
MQLRDKDKQMIIQVARQSFTQPVKIWAFGSRVNGQAHEGSDLDLVVIPSDEKSIDFDEFTDFKERLTESTIPILIQVMDWNRITESFKENILTAYVELVELDK